ncbi:MAG: DoxX family membrane protein [Pseudomonadota bacterium]
MASDATYSPTAAPFRAAVYNHYVAARAKGRVPGFDWTDRLAHWAIRIPLAGIMLTYGVQKFPDIFVAPGSYGVPAALFVLAAIAELLGPVALAIGGVIETWKPKQGWLRLSGDALTRAGGFAGVSAALGVIAFFYWGAVSISDPQILMLGLAAFLLLRGNR